MEQVFFIVLFILTIPLAVFLIFKPVMADKKVRNNVTNSDSRTRHYCFALHCNQTEMLEKLSIPNIYDALKYTLDKENLTIVFEEFGTSIEHKLTFYVVENKTYLKVSRVGSSRGKSNIPLMINRFFIEKIGAVPVDYSYFEATICTS